MRELNDEEKRFLEDSVPGLSSLTPEELNSRSRSKKPASRLARFLSYIPLMLGVVTIVLGGSLTYIYFWGKDILKVEQLKELEAQNLLEQLDPEMEGWFNQISSTFSYMPWVIFGVFLLGAGLMGLTIYLQRKRNG